jgi:hypothetical protein
MNQFAHERRIKKFGKGPFGPMVFGLVFVVMALERLHVV